jgi:hypothetical protein
MINYILSSVPACAQEQSQSVLDWLSLIIAFIALVISIITLIYSKRKEIEYDKFKTIAIGQIDEEFDVIFKLIERYKRNEIDLSYFSDALTNLTLLLLSLRSIYKKMDIDKLQDIINKFSDNVFENDGDILTNYIFMKTSLYSKIYNYALGSIPSKWSSSQNSDKDIL